MMPGQNPQALNAKRWRDVRAKAVAEGRLDEQSVATHKHRLLAALEHALAECQQTDGHRQETNDS
jgi:hypothetical protein